MNVCRVCGEQKPKEDFFNVSHFTKYKKHRVIWCKDCQKMYIEQRKEEQKKEEMKIWVPSHSVSFD